MTSRALFLLLGGLAACSGADRRAEAAPDDDEGMVAGSSDSLVLRAPGGQEIWFVGSRPAADSAGTL